jgi:hypothetical protein
VRVPDDQRPEIVTYRIPRIEVYQVTDDELRRIEEAGGQVGQDLTFAVAALSICVSFLIALTTATLSDLTRNIFIALVIVSAVVFSYTGLRWYRTRRTGPDTIASIRRRRTEPQPPP